MESISGRAPSSSAVMGVTGRIGRHLAMLPSAAILVLLVFVPVGMLVYFSLSSTSTPFPSLENYARTIEESLYPRLFVRSLWLAFHVTVICIVIAWPAGWALAKLVPKQLAILLLALLLVPYLTSYLLLIYAMLVLLSANGPLMSMLNAFHLASSESSILYTPWATLVMLVYENLPISVLILYAAAERIDDDLIDAARSLGAAGWQVTRRVICPLILPSLFACFVLVFIPVAGSFVEPQILGGPNGLLIGNVINDQITQVDNAPFGATLSLLLLLFVLTIVLLLHVLGKVISRIRGLVSDINAVTLGAESSGLQRHGS
jgi:spermidine/putrescine transport system permease protein